MFGHRKLVKVLSQRMLWAHFTWKYAPFANAWLFLFHSPISPWIPPACNKVVMGQHSNLSSNPAQATVFLTGSDFAKSLSPEMNSYLPRQLPSDKVVITCKETWSCSFSLLGPLANLAGGHVDEMDNGIRQQSSCGCPSAEHSVYFLRPLLITRTHWLSTVLPTTRENS